MSPIAQNCAKAGRRGLLIVFEGCDRSGKTTICQRLVEEFNKKVNVNSGPAEEGSDQRACHAMRFPDRTTLIGGVINDYLKVRSQFMVRRRFPDLQNIYFFQGDKQLDDHTIHLLFSSNRWEKLSEMKSALDSGVHVVVDRYAFSGVAFSAAKDGMSLEWCKNPDRNLPRPDLVCFLDVSPEEAQKRGGFGQER